MNRREVVGGIAVALLAVCRAKGQPRNKVWRLAFLGEGVARGPTARPVPGFFFDALQELGYINGQNLTIEFRTVGTQYERLPALAAELVELKPDVMVATSTQSLIALQRATSTIPIVMVLPGDPVGVGLVKSLAHPGGNVTGTSLMMPDIGGKRLEILKEVVPTLRRVAILGNTGNPAAAVEMRATDSAARSMGLEVQPFDIDSAELLEHRLVEIVKEKPDGLIVLLDSLTASRREQIATAALRGGVPSVVPDRMYVESGGLVGYGPNQMAIAGRAAVYVDKILKGAKPADLPVEQPTSFLLTVNTKTAKSLGISIPESLLARADEVIE